MQRVRHAGDLCHPFFFLALQFRRVLLFLPLQLPFALRHRQAHGLVCGLQCGFLLRLGVIGDGLCLGQRIFHGGFCLGLDPLCGGFRLGHGSVAPCDLAHGFAGQSFGAQNLQTSGANINPMHAAAHEAQAMRTALLLVLGLRLKEGCETNFHHQRRKKRDDESQHRVNPDPHHADLVGIQVAALLRGGLDGDRALALQQAAHNFHRGGDAVHLGALDRRLTRLVKPFRLLLAVIKFRADSVNLPRGRIIFRVNLLRLRRPLGDQRGQAGRQFFPFMVRFLALAAGANVKFLAQPMRVGLDLGNLLTAFAIDRG